MKTTSFLLGVGIMSSWEEKRAVRSRLDYQKRTCQWHISYQSHQSSFLVRTVFVTCQFLHSGKLQKTELVTPLLQYSGLNTTNAEVGRYFMDCLTSWKLREDGSLLCLWTLSLWLHSPLFPLSSHTVYQERK